MDIKGKILRPNLYLPGQDRGSGRVREYYLGKACRVFQITTFCPERDGPGPTHIYLIEAEKLILVDTGIPTLLLKSLFYSWRGRRIPDEIAALPDDYSEQELISALRLIGYDVSDIDYILLTHGHYDHYTLGTRLVELSGAKVAAHIYDISRIVNPHSLLDFWTRMMNYVLATGMPLPDFKRAKRKGGLDTLLRTTDSSLWLHVDYSIAAEGPLRIGDYQSEIIYVVHTPGHTNGGISLLLTDDNQNRVVMLCGDTILYPTTPQPDDLLTYLRTLKVLSRMCDPVLTLPAHGKVINNLRNRVSFLRKHHEGRLRQTYELCKKPSSIWQIATTKRYFDVFVDPDQFNPLAGQEAFIHVELLQLVGGLHRCSIENQIHFFQNSGENFDLVYQRIEEIIDDNHSTALMRRSF